MGKETNFERIKNMDINAMTNFLNDKVNTGACNDFGITHKRECDGECCECIKEWLETPVENYCSDCKYYMWGSCLHKESVHCNHSELWTPIGFGDYDISMFNLPKDVADMIELGIYTEKEIIEYIRRHR